MKKKEAQGSKQVALNYRQSFPTKDSDVKPIMVTEFNTSSVKDFYKEFIALDADDTVSVIPIIVSSYGGSVHGLLAMLDIMAASNKPIATIALGKAMSCGAVLLAAGTAGYRFAGASTDILIHEVSSGTVGKTSDMKNDVQATERLNKKLMQILAKAAGKEKNFFLDMSKKQGNVDLYFTAEQAKRLGLIDFIAIPSFLRS